MFLAPGTIKHHMLGLYEKLGAPNRAAAVHAARRLGILADHQELPPAPEPCAPLRVLIADPRDVRRTGALLALHGRPWVEACRGARTADDALAAADELRPDLVVVGDPELRRALDARGLVTLLVSDQDDIADAVLRACHGTQEPAPDPVSPRERDVLSALASGATNPAIARSWGSPPTPSSSTLPRSSASSGSATAPRRCGGPTNSGCWPRSDQQPFSPYGAGVAVGAGTSTSGRTGSSTASVPTPASESVACASTSVNSSMPNWLRLNTVSHHSW